MMGEEADADWQAGLVEWGAEDARRHDRERLTIGAIRNGVYNRQRHRRAMETKPFACDRCKRLCRTAGGLAQHKRDIHGGPLR